MLDYFKEIAEKYSLSLENVPIRQCTAPARNIFAKQPLENAGTWQGERKQSRA